MPICFGWTVFLTAFFLFTANLAFLFKKTPPDAVFVIFPYLTIWLALWPSKLSSNTTLVYFLIQTTVAWECLSSFASIHYDAITSSSPYSTSHLHSEPLIVLAWVTRIIDRSSFFHWPAQFLWKLFTFVNRWWLFHSALKSKQKIFRYVQVR